MKNSTTSTRPAFTWLFLATYANPDALPVVLRIQANTEEEARELLAGDFSLTFAAKIRTDCPVTCSWISSDHYSWTVLGSDVCETFGVSREGLGLTAGEHHV